MFIGTSAGTLLHADRCNERRCDAQGKHRSLTPVALWPRHLPITDALAFRVSPPLPLPPAWERCACLTGHLSALPAWAPCPQLAGLPDSTCTVWSVWVGYGAKDDGGPPTLKTYEFLDRVPV